MTMPDAFIPDEWGLDSVWPECNTCEGTGEVVNDYDREVTCPDCAGMGFIAPDEEDDE